MRRYSILKSAPGAYCCSRRCIFSWSVRDFIALLLAAAAHECGHLAALRAAGCRIRGFSADAGGAVIERRGRRRAGLGVDMPRRRAGCGIPLRAGGLAGGRGTGQRAAALLRRHERRALGLQPAALAAARRREDGAAHLRRQGRGNCGPAHSLGGVPRRLRRLRLRPRRRAVHRRERCCW